MRTIRRTTVGAGVMAAVILGGIAERDALACGGCIPPVGEQVTVVTDHRMVLAISPQQTTLYDQIEYQGDPESFAWVLPISGEVDVGLSADVVFGALDQITGTTVTAPPTRCPPPPPNCGGFAAGVDEGSAPRGGIDVKKQEVVGPYQTVQLHSTDPNALTKWLTDNGFAISEEVAGIIATYVAEHYDFLALKLVPGQGIHAMRPVRVSSAGAAPVLPLRMVAAGTGPTVGITLWVVADGRYETSNFPWFRIQDEELVWDWAQSRSNYTELRAQRQAELGGRGWEIESSIVVAKANVENVIRFSGTLAEDDYLPIENEHGAIVKTAEQVRSEDLQTLFAGIGVTDGQARITRLRSDVAHAALNTDLVLTASKDQSVLTNVRQATQELGEPLCPVWLGCQQVGTAPRSALEGGGDADTFSCATARAPSLDRVTLASLIAAAGIAIAGVRARRRRG